ncbi:CRISPR-associated endonuclease Cas2 [Romboutsia sp. CE17]|uniref:CRISPR-associated endonuclease Cas2 n=1 Tax=Romboutsia sp. CE17 TaxID=2724150 RepID=UPI001442AA7B|nr:CRISPR-associated endonuclease Cas2 [Romboutsia sp. CE17]QJA08408.1 CRISPR-associated endonuclease Cas2 [Romboutsia sp. CE17]
MFVIITYDIVEAKALNRSRKILKKYLTWTQNSVFEGEITDSKLHKCISEIRNVIDKNEDSIYVYEIKNPNNVEKKSYGVHKNFDEMFL